MGISARLGCYRELVMFAADCLTRYPAEKETAGLAKNVLRYGQSGGGKAGIIWLALSIG